VQTQGEDAELDRWSTCGTDAASGASLPERHCTAFGRGGRPPLPAVVVLFSPLGVLLCAPPPFGRMAGRRARPPSPAASREDRIGESRRASDARMLGWTEDLHGTVSPAIVPTRPSPIQIVTSTCLLMYLICSTRLTPSSRSKPHTYTSRKG